MNHLAVANAAFQKQQWTDAADHYLKALRESPALAQHVKFNLDLAIGRVRHTGTQSDIQALEAAKASALETPEAPAIPAQASPQHKEYIFFDAEYYSQQYGDVRRAGVNPESHYRAKGHKENRRPHPFFQPVKREVGYHDWYRTTLDSLGVVPFPQKPLNPREETIVPGHTAGQTEDNRSRIARVQAASRNRIVIYGANLGPRERLAQWPHLDGVDMFCFTDKTGARPEGIHYLDLEYYELEPKRTALFYKTHPHLYFDPYDIVIWCDQNVTIRNLSGILAALSSSSSPISTFKHWARDCLYEEAAAIKKSRRELPEIVDSQMDRYRKEGFPEHYGLFETNVLALRLSDLRIAPLMRRWWGEIVGGAGRDQLSFTYALWATKTTPSTLESTGLTARNSEKYRYRFHD